MLPVQIESSYDSAIYGTTLQGGANGEGSVFELSPTSGGVWTEKILHSFGNGLDGQFPSGGLISDAVGNLYGINHGRSLHIRLCV